MSRIYFGELHIDQISTNSGFFTGDNREQFWHYKQKINEGFGRNTGEGNRINWNQTILIDTDYVDIHNKRMDKRMESG